MRPADKGHHVTLASNDPGAPRTTTAKSSPSLQTLPAYGPQLSVVGRSTALSERVGNSCTSRYRCPTR